MLLFPFKSLVFSGTPEECASTTQPSPCRLILFVSYSPDAGLEACLGIISLTA